MTTRLRLYGILRDRVGTTARERALATIDAGTTVAELLYELGIQGAVQIAVNGDLVTDRQRQVVQGDTVEIFRSAAGG